MGKQGMVRLSVNVNKVATLRNSRGGQIPSVIEAVRVCLAAGAPGITVHPRADRRHITRKTCTKSPVNCIRCEDRSNSTSKGIRGRNFWRSLPRSVRTSARWCRCIPGKSPARRGGRPKLRPMKCGGLSMTSSPKVGVRVSLFVDPELEPVEWAARYESRPRRALYRAVRAAAF